MPASITDTFKEDLARTLYDNVLSIDNFYYVGIGRSNQWNNSDTPPDAVGSLNSIADFRMNLQSIMLGETVSHVAPRSNWSFGTVYEAYDTAEEDTLLDNTYHYIMTDANAVYICLEQGKDVNGNATASTVKPTGTSTNSFKTADGYVWKFLYTLGGTEQSNFLSANFMPVKLQGTTNIDSPATDIEQENIQDSAVSGEVLSIKVINGGEGYEETPTVIIDGDGSGASATATMVNGIITKIEMDIESDNTIAHGSGYRNARVILIGGSPTVDAQLDVVIAQGDGVGADSRLDLKATGIMFNIKPEGDEDDKFIVGNDFRQIGLIKNINNSAGDALYSELTGMALNYIQLEQVSTAFTNDRIIEGGASSARAYIDKFDSTNSRIYYHQNDDTGWEEFIAGELISEVAGDGAGTSDSTTPVVPGDVDVYSGDVLYIENRTSVDRTSDQVQDIKLVINF